MADAINDVCLAIADALVGWMLLLPTDLTLLIVSLLSALALMLLQRLTADQDLLARAASDRKRLKQLKKQAKAAKDKDALHRIRKTQGMISLRTARQEGKGLLIALIPLILLANWAYFRIEFHPPRTGEPIEVVLYLPLTAAGDVAHLVPQPGVELIESDSWVRVITPVEDELGTLGQARWRIAGQARPEPYQLVFRHRDRDIERELRIEHRTYSDPIVFHDEQQQTITRLIMREVKLFGIVPGIPALAFPPWLVAYVVITVPFVFLLKWLARPRQHHVAVDVYQHPAPDEPRA